MPQAGTIHNGAGVKRTGHYYRCWTPWDDACITCGERLGDNPEHFPDSLVDAGHVSSCSIYCENCYRHDGDCGEEHLCNSPEHLIP